MSILRKPYEISVWDDVWSTTESKFVEQRLGIIGSSEMESQSRVIEPELTRNVNGTKKFSFKLYKRYRDNITGETVENPFYNWLTNERKVKLKYDGEWYDFVVKNISEPSSNYLYTYQLEDANVQELSKNGFNFIFDPELQNNLGTSQELAADLLAETDWTVGECDVPVQTIDEALVYLIITKEGGINATQIIDPVKDEKGVEQGVTFETLTVLDNGEKEPITLSAGTVVLAAYSSCTSRPHRFQFFYTGDEKITCDDDRFINNKNCQYYIDIDDPVNGYHNSGDYIVPTGFNTTTVTEGESVVILSAEYRGKRYGFTQQTQYIPKLNRYINIYEKKITHENGEKEYKEYYGYENTEYHSSVLIQNLISGSELKSTSGWTGATTDQGGEKVEIEAIYGRDDGGIVSVIEDLSTGSFDTDYTYFPCLKVTFPTSGEGILINSGPYDNRRFIGNMEVGDQYKISFATHGDSDGLSFALGEYKYKNGYYDIDSRNISFSRVQNSDNIFKVDSSIYSEEKFKKDSQVRLAIFGIAGKTYYITNVELYKVVRKDNGEIITPNSQAQKLLSNTVETTYYYVDPTSGFTSPETVVPTAIAKTLTYDTYKPVYNEGACKTRTVTAKESNYFNILQSIAETFEQWLDIKVTHDDSGKITKKEIFFRNYISGNNYVGFKYGVNLKDIKRTYESKKLVTKLIVKQNSNEFAPNGFCSIARANANPTGENSIYDFQYFFNTGMMSARDYLETTYVEKQNSTSAVQGYFPLIKDLNIQINKNNDLLLNISKDLVQVGAELEVAIVGLEAAKQGMEDSDDAVRFLTGVDIAHLHQKFTSEEVKELIDRSDVKRALQEYSVYLAEEKKYSAEKTRLNTLKTTIENKYNELQEVITNYTKEKNDLHKEFFKSYGRFIQEGTWINEEYVNHEKYYADAQSVLYNSCYPKVAYDINVIEISRLPGYELYTYNLGDTTFVEDKEFFGEDFRVKVVVTETSDNLDDPTKNKIKVQNFTTQFQDLFQKITATVQQAQYSTGSYEKAVALAEASQERKQQFLTDALDGMNSRLAVAGQQTVVIDNNGITVTDNDTPSDSIRMVGGAIMLSKQDANGETKWTTGLTSDGMSASLITAGVINAGQIAIMNSDQPTFRWDSYGISAFKTTWHEGVISGFDNSKFVRFDKNGIYGIDGTVNGLNWHPQDGRELDDINSKATFALTWDGLKVTGNNNAVAHIGKVDGNIINITQGTGKNKKSTFRVSNTGDVYLSGNFTIGGIDSSSGSSEETTFIDYVKEQVDKKASLYYLNKDPALYEDNNKTGEKAWGADQIGSMWRCTAKIQSNKSTKDSTLVTRDANSEWIWQKLSETEYGWHEMEIPDNIFDAYDGKNTIHVKKPNNYKERDLWIVDETYTFNEKKYTVGTLMVAINNSSGEWSAADWEEKVKYMDPNVDTNNFSWKFDKNDGMYMYTGSQEVKKNAVFKIYKDAEDNNNYKLWMNGNGNFTGTIIASGGKIAGFDIIKTNDQNQYIGSNGKSSYDDNTNGIYLGQDGIGLGGNFSVSNTGNVTIKSGSINIGNGNFVVGSSGKVTIKSGSIELGDNFSVDSEGNVTATDANITGVITAKKGGSIGGFAIDDAYISKDKTSYSDNTAGVYIGTDGIGLGAGKFYVDSSGNATLAGNITLSGNIVWGENNAPQNGDTIYITYLYCGNNTGREPSTPTYNGTSGTLENWKLTPPSTESYDYIFISQCTVTNGKYGEWSKPVLWTNYAYDGEDGADGDDGSDASVNETNVFNVLTNGGTKFGIFSDSTTSKLYINANYIKAGKISADYIDADGISAEDVSLTGNFECSNSNMSIILKNGELTQEQYYNFYNFRAYKTAAYSEYKNVDKGFHVTIGVVNSGANAGYISAAQSGRDVIYFYPEYSKLTKTWKSSSAISVDSDRNCKNSITSLSDSYEVLFDNLYPVSYKYNEGTSNRTHTGFIAQDVERAVLTAGLTTQEFAGYVSFHNIDENGIENKELGLRYEEFISLNTWQIQKLKTRVTELENKLNSLLQGENINEATNNI